MFKKSDKTIKVLAIESSCDETAGAVIRVTCNAKHVTKLDIESNIILSQVKLHAKYGGVYPELASREHIRNIIPVIREALEQRNIETQEQRNIKTGFSVSKSLIPVDYIAVTSGPGLIGSLLVGVNTAKTMAYALKKPIYAINHLEGHIYSCFAGDEKPEFPILALIVSGGHTSLIIMKDHFDYQIIGETLDDAVGESFDKVAKMMGLGYPGGPIVSKLSLSGKKNDGIKFPRPMINSKDFNFSFSGIKTSVLYTLKKLPKKLSKQTQADICKEFQEAVVETLVSKTLRAARKYRVKSILLCGGVSANSRLRQEFDHQLTTGNYQQRFFVPEKSLTGDNATMIGIAAAYRIALGKKPTPWYDVNVDPNLQF